MKEKSKTKPAGTQRHLCRRGKIARLPHAVRGELNLRLHDGESGRGLVLWLNELPEVKAALKREFDGIAITEQNLSDWRLGGFRDWVAKSEAEELMADTLGEGWDAKCVGGSRNSSSRKGSREKDGEVESDSDRVAEWFFPYYVAATRGQLTAAETPNERWSVLRIICADLAGLRRSDHYVERLRIWQEKLRMEMEGGKEMTEEEIVEWVRDHPAIERKIWPDREHLTHAEKRRQVRRILGISNADDDADRPDETPDPAGEVYAETVEK